MLNKRALKFSLFLTLILLITGLASVPYAANFSPMIGNIIYAVFRIPIIYVAFLTFKELGKCSKTHR